MTSEFNRLLDVARDRRLPPVDQWHPERVGEIDIRIRADGVWFHEGSQIKRHSIAKVFSTILRRDGDDYYLVTPGEKLRIVVEDAPFVAVAMEVEGAGRSQKLLFTTNCDDHVVADADHPINVVDNGGEPRPYVRIRGGMDALIVRSVFYRLVDLVEMIEGDEELAVYSDGVRFVLGRV